MRNSSSSNDYFEVKMTYLSKHSVDSRTVKDSSFQTFLARTQELFKIQTVPAYARDIYRNYCPLLSYCPLHLFTQRTTQKATSTKRKPLRGFLLIKNTKSFGFVKEKS